ncbi:MAG: hypothetical protein ACKPJH_05765, partial [Dolichospermum sp.]
FERGLNMYLIRAETPVSNLQDLRKISLKPSFLRSLRSYAFGTLRERGSLFRDLCVSPNLFTLSLLVITHPMYLILQIFSEN